MINERDEVAVGEEQGQLLLDAAGGNAYVRSFSDRHSFFAQCPVVRCALLGHAFSRRFMLIQHHEALPGRAVFPVASDSLKNLRKHQSPQGNDALDNRIVKSAGDSPYEPSAWHSSIGFEAG